MDRYANVVVQDSFKVASKAMANAAIWHMESHMGTPRIVMIRQWQACQEQESDIDHPPCWTISTHLLHRIQHRF